MSGVESVGDGDDNNNGSNNDNDNNNDDTLEDQLDLDEDETLAEDTKNEVSQARVDYYYNVYVGPSERTRRVSLRSSSFAQRAVIALID